MREPAQPDNESERLNALRETRLLDSRADPAFDRITRMAAKLLEVPTVLVSLVDDHRQWFKSRYGLDASETARSISFCGHTILQRDIFVVENATAHPDFCDNPLVTDAPHIRFYAGAPICTPDGHRIGTLCLIDYKPRSFSGTQKSLHRFLADQVETQIALQLETLRRDAFECLHRIALSNLETPQERIRAALQEANAYLGTAHGIVSQIEDDQYHILAEYQVSDPEGTTPTLDYRETYCYHMLLPEQKVIACSNMANGPFRNSPCYRNMGLETYIGCPLVLDDARIGTLNFTSPEPRNPSFSSIEKDFVLLLAAWLTTQVRQLQLMSEKDDSIHRIHTLLESVADAIFVVSESGKILSFNRAASGLFSLPTDSASSGSVLSLLETASQANFINALDAVKQQGHSINNLELAGLSKDGTRLSLLASVAPVENDSEEAAVIVFHEIGYFKALEDQRRAFISTVSHELRTPLTSLNGALALLQNLHQQDLPEKAVQLLGIAGQNAVNLQRLINDLLDYERFRDGQLEFQTADVEAGPLLKTAISSLEGYASPREVSLVLSDETEGHRIHVDPDRMAQVLNNLLSNAIKFSPKGASVQLIGRLENGSVVMEVIDQGSGIPREFQERLFTRFAQAQNAGDRGNQGSSGLGLAISRQLVEHMGGSIGFSSTPGKGSRFYTRFEALAPAK